MYTSWSLCYRGQTESLETDFKKTFSVNEHVCVNVLFKKGKKKTQNNFCRIIIKTIKNGGLLLSGYMTARAKSSVVGKGWKILI